MKIVTDFNGEIYKSSNTNLLLYLTGIFILLFKDVKDEFWTGRHTVFDKKIVKWVVCLLLFVLIVSVGVLDSGQFIYANF